ncbi:twitching motility protein PilT [Acetitomaculum ruminis DSM 5522]|uniref:Twitching motility protein PilT n=1 Tax=Acetitomaculum ruminis DSM 5522 TaxID=1120918 RepID=A0A1I0XT57_9FIRM|nr:PilT/PilU family type 4a pilus ATPase [Acetitomaculum ruminis]SFB03163.1 twitching motility protein PilT [Acetitomaculum ruminis DSM 5522]
MIKEILEKIVDLGASDIFLVAGIPLTYKLKGTMYHYSEDKLKPEDTFNYLNEIYELAGNRKRQLYDKKGDDDFSFSIVNCSRFRVSAYKQRGSDSAVIRVITFSLPDHKELGIPESVIDLTKMTKGLILVTGPAGSGKSTTQACLIDKINRECQKHIITLEDPLEYLHRHKKSIVSQREISSDTESYLTALRAALRQSPDVILLGEMRDYETMSVAMTAAETGHLIISTLHTIGAANTIDRILDSFPPSQQHQIAIQLSMVLRAVVSQQLLPTVDGKILPAFEIMTLTPAIRNMIRENKIHQIDSAIQTSQDKQMITMDNSILTLYKEGKITGATALRNASNPEMMEKKIKL